MRFSGIWPILYAFFRPDGALDRDAMRAQVNAVVAGGAHGLAVLGLATEVSKLDTTERRAVVEWAADDLAGRLPLAVTIFGATVAEQAEAVAHAADHGAALAILQPPRGMPAPALMALFGGVMRTATIACGLQNAPEFLGTGLSPDEIAALAEAEPRFQVLKGEGPATVIAGTVARTGGRLAVFNGRGGLELPDNLRAGCAGLIPAPDVFELQVAIFAAMQRGDEAEAERLYRATLPAIVFAMQGIDHLVCYGKRLVAARLGLGPVTDRAPALPPTAFGDAVVARLAAELGPYRV